MRMLLIILLALAVAFGLAGCGKNQAEQSTVVEVENPQEPELAATGQEHDHANCEDHDHAPAPPPAPSDEPAEKPAAARGGWFKFKSGLEYKDKKTGAGAEAKSGDRITVHYKGWLDDGTEFDASRKHGKPFEFVLGTGSVIKGWDEGVKGMKVGGTRELKIPPSLGYGDMDQGTIPPNSTLHFDVELIEVED